MAEVEGFRITLRIPTLLKLRETGRRSLRFLLAMTNMSVIARPKAEAIPMEEKQYYIYIMTNCRNTVLYVGVTNNLVRRVFEHREKLSDGFTNKYNITKLVYYEIVGDVNEAIAREKQIKGGSRQKKINLIQSLNPKWCDLYEEIASSA